MDPGNIRAETLPVTILNDIIEMGETDPPTLERKLGRLRRMLQSLSPQVRCRSGMFKLFAERTTSCIMTRLVQVAH